MERQSGILETEKFVQENSLQCKLFIQQSDHVCQIAVVDDQNQIRLLRESIPEQAFKENTEILSLRFRRTSLVVFPHKIFLLPQELQGGEHYPILAELNGIEPDEANTSLIISQQCVANFLARDEFQFWISLLKEVHLIPTTTIIINELSNLKVKYKALVGLNFFNDSFEIVVLEDSALRFHNTFKANTADEFNFFLLTIFNKFGITPSITQFYIWGIDEENEYYKRLEKYTRNISFPHLLHETLTVEGSGKELSDIHILTGAIACESSQET